MSATEYVVLRKSDSGSWHEDGTVAARDANTAIRRTYESHMLDGGSHPVATFVAVPSRSWNPVTVTPKVETTLILGAAS